MLMMRYGPCRGITLFKLGRRKIELWIIPRGYTIPEHSHNNEDIELMLLAGDGTELFRREPYYDDVSGIKVGYSEHRDNHTARFPKDFCRKFSIPAGFAHGFTVAKRRLIFINFAKWRHGVTITGAHIDFQEINTTKLCPTIESSKVEPILDGLVH